MNRRAAIGWSLLGLLSLAPCLAVAGDTNARPLRLALAAPPSSLGKSRPAELHSDHNRTGTGNSRAAARLAERDPSLGQRALLSVLDAPEPGSDDLPDASAPGDRFKFERRGSAGRDLSRGYRDMCAKVSNKVWDDPNGRRVKFDIAGKPGVALVIPLR
jgi:hypothetical protein